VLSVEQTIALCYNLPWNNCLLRANPEALSLVRRVALKSNDGKAADFALKLLGFIGTEEDLDLCLQTIEAELTQPIARTRRTENAFLGLRRFAQRRIGRADENLKEMATFEYWNDKRFDPRRKARTPTNFAEDTLAAAIYALAGADLPTAQQLAEKAIREAPPGKLEEWAQYRLNPEKVKNHRDAIERDTNTEITSEELEALNAVYFSIDGTEIERLGLPKPQVTLLSPRYPHIRIPRALSNEEKAMATTEAKAAFEKISDQMRNRQYKEVTSRLIYGLWQSRNPKDIREVPEDARLDEMRSLLLEIDALQPKPGEPVAAPGNTGSFEIITVAWELPGTEAIGQRIWTSNVYQSGIENGTGRLIVVMKKKKGIWYWNPFGWDI
jgi:hypothetical protein